MNPLYQRCKTIFAGLFTFTSFSLFAQPLEFLNINNVNAGIGVGGNLFSMTDSLRTIWNIPDTLDKYWLFEVPKGTGRTAIATASIWMSGFDVQWGIPHCAAHGYKYNGADYYDGPIQSVYDSLYDYFYTRVFKVTRQQIERHRTLPTSPFPSGIDSSILYWPGIGNQQILAKHQISIQSPLAPFVDIDHDGFYNPLKGDYPAICGDEAIFFVFNDVRSQHHETRTNNPLGFEVRGMAYIFYNSNLSMSKGAINNTVFVSYEIENKSEFDYRDFHLALWEDPDVGCFNNDRVGCDTLRNLMIAYNGTTPDPDCQNQEGYTPFQAAHGVKILNEKMSAFSYFTNGSPYGMQDPTSYAMSCYELINLQNGLWRDGTPFYYGGSGHNSPITKFMFSGDLNDPNQWSEVNPNVSAILQPSDRRMYGSIGPMDFKQGEVKHFDFAFIVSYDSTATMISIVDTLKRDADIIQQFYDQQITTCRNQIFSGLNEMGAEELGVLIYPNPGSGLVNVESVERMQQIELMDMQGRTVMQKVSGEKKIALDVSLFAKGAYLLKISATGKTSFRKLMVR